MSPVWRLTQIVLQALEQHVVESITGHLSRRMLERYSHIRLKAKKAALDRVREGRNAEEREMTFTVTDRVGQEGESARKDGSTLTPYPSPYAPRLAGAAAARARWLPAVVGNGYEPLNDILDSGISITGVAVLVIAKIVAPSASVTSGIPGGVSRRCSWWERHSARAGRPWGAQCRIRPRQLRPS